MTSWPRSTSASARWATIRSVPLQSPGGTASYRGEIWAIFIVEPEDDWARISRAVLPAVGRPGETIERLRRLQRCAVFRPAPGSRGQLSAEEIGRRGTGDALRAQAGDALGRIGLSAAHRRRMCLAKSAEASG